MDICQSVLGNFFVRATAGEFDLESPEQLLKLLVTMARNRLTDQALRHRAARRDHRRTEPAISASAGLVDPGPSASELVTRKELLEAFRGRLSPAERTLADQRAQGRAWTEIAAEIGGSPGCSARSVESGHRSRHARAAT